MSINLTDEIEVKTKKGKLGAAKQIFLEGDTTSLQKEHEDNQSHFDTLDNRSSQMEESIKNISVTGGASVASAVTYDNTASGLKAVNVKAAIDELAIKNKSQDSEISKKANTADVTSQIQAEQNRVNAELDKKFNKESILQESGEAEDKVMSQKATTTAIEVEKNRAESAEQAILFDVSANNNGAVFESLSALLSSSNLNTLIPTSVRHGGMSIRFIQGSKQSSDNKYVQYMYKVTDAATVAAFTNVVNWEKVNLEDKINQLSKDVNMLDTSIFGLNNVIDIETTAGTKVDNTAKHYISVVSNVEFQIEYTDNGVLPSNGSISVTFYDANDNPLSILVDNVSKETIYFSALVVNHLIKCVSDISYFKVYTGSTSIPTSDAGVSFTITQGENTIKEQIDVLEADLVGETTTRGNADANLQGQINFIAKSVLVKKELTPTILSSYEISNGVISLASIAQRSVLYVPILEGYKISVTLTNTSTSNKGYYGYTTELPSNGITVNSANEIGDATKIDWTAPTDGYFVIGIHATYHKKVKMYRIVGLAEKMSELEETINVTDKKNEHASIYDNKVLNVLYSVLSGIPGNTEAHFMDGIERGFNGLKADMRMTSDGKIILCHDAGFTLDSNGRITTYDAENNTEIHNLTISQCLKLEFAEQVNGQYIHPCSLDRFLFLCKKYGVVPYVTIRWDDYKDATLAEFYRLLKHYNLVDKVIINLFTGAPQWATKIQATDATLMCCNTISTGENLTGSAIDDCFDWGCNYVCVYYKNFASITDELVQYAFSKNVRIMVYGIHTKEEFDECVAGGVVGFQNYSRTAVFPL